MNKKFNEIEKKSHPITQLPEYQSNFNTAKKAQNRKICENRNQIR